MDDDIASKTNTLDLLGQLKIHMPEIWNQAKVVGRWVWLEFAMAPENTVRSKLKELGFHWNGKRKCWQHPCGVQSERSDGNPKGKYEVISAADWSPDGANHPSAISSKEYKVVALRELPLPEAMQCFDAPQKAADYWRQNIETNPYFNRECECFAVLMLNTRLRMKGHVLISIGTMDTVLVHPREVFRAAIITAASKVVIMHNHPSGEAQPSEADIRVTRDVIRAGQLLKIEVLDHVIVGTSRHSSLRELGYFAS